jgi:hypothetical protein
MGEFEAKSKSKLASSMQPDAREFEFGDPPPTFDDPLEERQYLKERLACAYR